MDNNKNKYKICDTKYPIFMIHGMGFRDSEIGYWGRIPDTLKKYGAKVFFGFQDANGSIESNCVKLEKSLLDFISESGTEKVNIIAHSKGGIEARYLISTMGLGKYIASVTTISSPHNGSKTMDKLMKLPDFLLRGGSSVFDFFMKLGGDGNPQTYRCLEQLTTGFMNGFNEKNPDEPDIYYRSYAFEMRSVFSDVIMAVPWATVKMLNGRSDGMLSPEEVAWGDFKGVFTGTGRRGISHPDEVDMRRVNFSRRKPESQYEISDITKFYVKIVSELKEMGF
ncbi:MAG: hypothetical protein K2J37_01330 [Ruminococcus sp.]|nr:hypothetical protein [Ruminococcus sp.]MDE6784419.1 hypothetical protein [Ruminococcus sp.]